MVTSGEIPYAESEAKGVPRAHLRVAAQLKFAMPLTVGGPAFANLPLQHEADSPQRRPERGRFRCLSCCGKAENRKDARVAREFEVALPHELSSEQRISLTREFAQELANRHGAAVDFAVHQPHSPSDVRNHHAHIMMTTRQVTGEGLSEKTYIERENKWLLSNDLP